MVCGQASQFNGENLFNYDRPYSIFYKENIVKHCLHVCLSWWSSVAQVRSASDWSSGAGRVTRTTPPITSSATSRRRQEPSPVTSHRVLSRAGNEAKLAKISQSRRVYFPWPWVNVSLAKRPLNDCTTSNFAEVGFQL